MHDPKLPFNSNFCKCSACGEYFRNVRAFEYHRRTTTGLKKDNAVSVTPCTSFDALVKDDKGYWRYPKGKTPEFKTNG